MNACGQLELVIDKDRADSFCDWARATWAVEPVCLERPYGRRAVVKLYFENLAVAQTFRRRLPKDFAISAARATSCPEQQWTTFWRHHFQITETGRRLRIVPVWKPAPDRRRINLRIDPGLSFGTGDHFTTRFCLEEVERACAEFDPDSMLDAGTGSGILAIAAAKLGIPSVAAFDNDPVCLTRCRANAALNRLQAGRIRFFRGDVRQAGWRRRRADLVCANILTGVLIAAAPALWAATRRRLVLTGIREFEGDSVADVFVTQGAREIRRDGDGEWCGLVLDQPGGAAPLRRVPDASPFP